MSLKKELSDMVSDSDESYVKNEHAFRMDYVPEELIERDDKVKEIFGGLRKTVLGKPTASDIVIFGQKGTGKTATMKKTIEYLKEVNIEKDGVGEYFYISARECSGLVELLHNLLGVQKDGYFNTAGRYWDIIENKANNGYVTLFFDDFDKFERSYEKAAQRVLNKLLDMDMVSIIVVGNRKNFKKEVIAKHEDNLSRARIKTVIFDQYSEDELFKIVKQRARFISDDVYDEDILRYLVKNIDDGDARMGVKVLQRSAMIAEGENIEINKDHVNRAIDKFMDVKDLTFIASLQEEYIVFLESVVKSIRNDEPPIMDIIKHYFDKIASERGMKTKSEVTLYRYARVLSNKYDVISRKDWEDNKQVKVHKPEFDTDAFLDSIPELYNT